MDQLRLRLLGGVSVELRGEELGYHLPAKALALVIYLSVTSEAQTRDSLANVLWSDFPDQRARGNLRDTLARLRRTALAPYLHIERRTVALSSDAPVWLDTAEFQQNTKGRTDPASLDTAAALYQGEFLAGFAVPKAALFEEWVAMQRQHMHQTAVEALGQLVDCYLDTGDYETGITHAQHLLLLDFWREETHRKLMLLFLLNGDHSAALNQYGQCCKILHEELGVEPSLETQTLYQSIHRQLKNQIAAGEVPDTSTPTGLVPHNIPDQATPFIGRVREQRAIEIVLDDRTGRLTTLFGVGGIGKTRLALAIAEKQLQTIERNGEFRFPDGVFFVPLEAVESPDEIVPALCQALGFQPAEESRAGRSTEEQLLDYLRCKRLLLVIDNFEHLLDGVGLLARINHAAPDTHLLVTSRQKLGLHGERLYSLEGLLYPQISVPVTEAEKLLASYSAATLFVASARRVNADYQLDDEEAAALARLCRLVEGLPLALELAAGWTNVLSLDDIVAEITQGLSFLESDLHDLPDRHRSMGAVFDVSWRWLCEEEKKIFAQLCVFRGGFTRQAAMEITGASLRQLALLSNKAKIQYNKKTDRYHIHRLLRQFGADKLAQDPTVEKRARDCHCAYYCAALYEWDKGLKGANQLQTLAELDNESANMRSAWLHAVKNTKLAELDQAVDGLNRFYLWRRRFHEGEKAARLAEEVLSYRLAAAEAGVNAAQTQRILARIQTWRSVFVERKKADGLVAQALRTLNSSQLAHLDTRRERAFALQRAGDLAFDDYSQEARRLYRQSLILYRELDDAWEAARLLTAADWLGAHNGEMKEAQRLGREALALVRTLGDHKRMADALWLLGTVAIIDGRVEESTQLLGESLDIRQRLGDRITDIAAGPLDLGMTLTWIGRMAEADAVREEALALYEAQGQPEQIALAHVRLATSKLHIGDFAAVERHARIGLQLCRKEGSRRGSGLALWVLGWLADITGEVEQAELCLQESLALFRDIDGAFELGWVLCMYADIANQQGRRAAARKYIYESLRDSSGVLGSITIIMALTSYINLLAVEGRDEQALEIGALLDQHPIMRESRGGRMVYSKHLAEIEAALPPEVVAATQARGRARDLQETAKEVMAELEPVEQASSV